MSMKSAPEEKIAAESFLSNLPHFVRIMKKFNISGSFTMVGNQCIYYLFEWLYFYGLIKHNAVMQSVNRLRKAQKKKIANREKT